MPLFRGQPYHMLPSAAAMSFQTSRMHHAHHMTVCIVAAATAGYTQRHPDVPVVEQLEDLWLLQKLQQDRAQRQDRTQPHNRAHQQDRTQQQAAKDGVSRTQPSHPAATAAARTARGTGFTAAAAAAAAEQQQGAAGRSSSTAVMLKVQAVADSGSDVCAVAADSGTQSSRGCSGAMEASAAADTGYVPACTKRQAPADDISGQTTAGALTGLEGECTFVDLDELD
jgi:hypothetical protein